MATKIRVGEAEHSHLIDGRMVGSSGGDAIEVYDPATGDLIREVGAGTAADVDAATAAARACFDSRAWTGLGAHDRSAKMWALGDLIADHVDELAELEVRDNGMSLAFARQSVAGAVTGLRYYAGLVTKLHGLSTDLSTPARQMHAYTIGEPVGVVGAITPWNVPFGLLVGKIAPAIAAGCSVVAKPAEQTPLSALRLAEIIAASDILPPGLVNIVNGTGTVAGQRLAEHPDVDKITFTGSTAVGRKLIQAAAGNLKRVTLELGGKSPLFIFDDADLDRAIPAAAMAVFANSGQICIAGSRLYVQSSIYDRVIEGVAKFGAGLRLGSGLDQDTQMGPLVSEAQLARVMSYIESGVSEGAELLGDGGRRYGDKGYFMTPAVFANRERKSLKITREEIFGPVITAMPFDGLDELAGLANDTDYGLGAGVFTSNVSTAHRAAAMIRAGNVWINCYAVLDKMMPFGGFRQSGWGRESGLEGISPFLETKSVYTML